MEKINFKSISKELSREEMKYIMAGSGPCPQTLTCPGEFPVSCEDYDVGCYVENSGTCSGFLICNGSVEVACWCEGACKGYTGGLCP